MISIRPEAPNDEDAVHRLNLAAFEGGPERRVVDALRASSARYVAFVAEEEGRVLEEGRVDRQQRRPAGVLGVPEEGREHGEGDRGLADQLRPLAEALGVGDGELLEVVHEADGCETGLLWEIGNQVFRDTCMPTDTYPADGAGLLQYDASVDADGKLIVDLNQDDGVEDDQPEG